MTSTVTETTSEPIQCDEYTRAGWHYELLYYPASGELRIIVTGADNVNVDGSKKRMKFRRVFAPTGELAHAVFNEPFGYLRFELTDEASYEPLPDK